MVTPGPMAAAGSQTSDGSFIVNNQEKAARRAGFCSRCPQHPSHPIHPIQALTRSGAHADLSSPSDLRHTMPRFADGALEANLAVVDVVRSFAEEQLATPAQV